MRHDKGKSKGKDKSTSERMRMEELGNAAISQVCPLSGWEKKH